MIYVLHGEDYFSSYQRLSQILQSNKNLPKIYLKEETALSYEEVISSQDLINPQKIIVANDYLSSKKIKPEKIVDNSDFIVIFHEKKELSKSSLNKFSAKVTVELFKPPQNLFYFLDSLSFQNKLTTEKFLKLSKENQEGLLWNIQNRFFLLILAKMNFTQEEASKVVERNIFDWQWQKLKDQSKRFDIETLKKIFNSTLRVDFLIKSGSTNMAQTDLLSLLFLKYFHT